MAQARERCSFLPLKASALFSPKRMPSAACSFHCSPLPLPAWHCIVYFIVALLCKMHVSFIKFSPHSHGVCCLGAACCRVFFYIGARTYSGTIGWAKYAYPLPRGCGSVCDHKNMCVYSVERGEASSKRRKQCLVSGIVERPVLYHWAGNNTHTQTRKVTQTKHIYTYTQSNACLFRLHATAEGAHRA